MQKKARGEPRTCWENRPGEILFDVGQHFIQAHDISSQILAIGALAFVGAAWQQFVVSSIAIVVLHEVNIVRALHEHGDLRPHGWLVVRWSGHERGVVESVGSEAGVDTGKRNVGERAAGFRPAFVPDRIFAGYYNVVGEDESVHRRGCTFVAGDNNATLRIRNAGDVVDGDRIDRILRPAIGNQEQPTETAGVIPADVVHDDIVNAEAHSGLGGRSTFSVAGDDGGHDDATTAVGDVRVANRHIGDLADRADVVAALGVLVFRSQQDGESGLAKAAPNVFHQVAFGEDADCVLEFKMIFDYERLARRSTLERGVAWHPLPWLEEK